MPVCSIATCTNNPHNCKGKDISFFRFPPNPVLRKAWLKVCKRNDKPNTKNAVICSEHFEPHLIEGTLGRQFGLQKKRNLVKNAVPTLKLPAEILQPVEKQQLAKTRKDRYAKREIRKRVLESLKTFSAEKKLAAISASAESPESSTCDVEDEFTITVTEPECNLSEMTDHLELQDNDSVVVEVVVLENDRTSKGVLEKQLVEVKEKNARLEKETAKLQKKLKAARRRELILQAQIVKLKYRHLATRRKSRCWFKSPGVHFLNTRTMPVCSIATCTNNTHNCKGKDVSFFHFPPNPVLCKAWLKVCKRKDKPNTKNALICSEHFEPHLIEGTLGRQFGLLKKRNLVKNAVPTLKLPAEILQPVEKQQLAKTRKDRYAKREVRKRVLESLKTFSAEKKLAAVAASAESPGSSTCDVEDEFTITVTEPECNLSEMNDHLELQDNNSVVVEVVVLENDRTSTDVLEKQLVEVKEKNSRLEKETAKLQKKLKAARRRELILRAQIVKLKYRHLATRRKSRVHVNDKEKKVREILKSTFRPAQICSLLSKNKAVKWGNEDFLQALTLRSLSRQSYSYLTKTLNFPLPSLCSLRKWTEEFRCEPGILNNVLEVLKSKPFGQMDKYCVLSLGKMKLDPKICYDSQDDIAYGPYSTAQVVIISGLFSSWEQLIYYAFDVEMTKKCFLEIISKVEDAGLHVVTCVSDLASENSDLWRSLHITEHSPYFLHPCKASQRVWVFSDIPNILKTLHNHVLNEGIVLQDQTLINRAVLTELVQWESGLHSLTHTNFEGHELQSSLVKQLFSADIYEAIYKFLPHRRKCADFVKLIKDVYDIFNSSTQLPSSSESLSSSFGMRLQEQTLLTMQQVCSEMRVSGVKGLLPFQKEMLVSISALFGLYKDLQKVGARFLNTEKVSKECVARLFRDLHGLGQFRQYLLASEFKARLRLLIVGANVSPVSTSQAGNKSKMVTQSMMAGLVRPEVVRRILESIKTSSLDEINLVTTSTLH